ncbi:MAG: HAD family hydrolase [Akkermansiaceae bacterium]
MQPRALLFDFDGVILDTEWPIYQTWLAFFEKHGQQLPLETYIKCIGSDFETWSPEQHFEELTGLKPDWEDFHETRNVEIRQEVAKLDIMPGLRDLLTFIQNQKIPCAVVSSSSHSWVDHWLENHQLMPFFTKVVCRGDAPRIKPAPDLFVEACRQLDLPAADCLVIEDSRNGLIAAHDAGCPVAAIPNRITACIDFSNAEFQFTDLPGLHEFLRNTVASEESSP